MRTEQVEIGDAVARFPCLHGGQGGGREQQAGEGMLKADHVNGPGRAVLRYPGRLYEVRHQRPVA
ncbi:hypothetical protein ACWGJX_33290 [Streptomyces sp. NPDC054775]